MIIIGAVCLSVCNVFAYFFFSRTGHHPTIQPRHWRPKAGMCLVMMMMMMMTMMIMMMIMMIMMIISPPLQGEAASVNSEREVVPRTAQQGVRQAQQVQYEWKLTKNITFFYYLVHLALVAPLTSANGPVFKHKIICN